MARLAVDLQAQGFNVLRTEEAGKDTASDEEQLAFATQQGRSTHIFAPLHERWQSEGRHHAGVVVSQQLGGRQYGLLLQRMQRFLNHFSAEQMVDNFVHLEQFK